MSDTKYVLVTGATSGIGEASAKRLAENGWTVIAAGRNEEKLAQLKADGIAAHTLVADLSQTDQPRELGKRCLEITKGKLHGLLHAAGILIGGGMDNGTDEVFDIQMQVNLTASYRLLSEVWPGLVAVKGSAVLVSSVTGLRAFPGLVGYCVSKAGVDQLVRCAALDGAPQGVRVNGINPGVVVTELHKRGGMPEENYGPFLEHSKTTHPLGRVGTPEEIADAALFLLNDTSGWITGASLPVDGGRHQTCAR